MFTSENNTIVLSLTLIVLIKQARLFSPFLSRNHANKKSVKLTQNPLVSLKKIESFQTFCELYIFPIHCCSCQHLYLYIHWLLKMIGQLLIFFLSYEWKNWVITVLPIESSLELNRWGVESIELIEMDLTRNMTSLEHFTRRIHPGKTRTLISDILWRERTPI